MIVAEEIQIRCKIKQVTLPAVHLIKIYTATNSERFLTNIHTYILYYLSPWGLFEDNMVLKLIILDSTKIKIKINTITFN